jgi:hypothetical protein
MQAEPDPPLILERELPQDPEPVRILLPDGYVVEEGELQ